MTAHSRRGEFHLADIYVILGGRANTVNGRIFNLSREVIFDVFG